MDVYRWQGKKKKLSALEIDNLLSEAGCIKKGSFILKSGKEVTSYFDLRMLTSKPHILGQIAEELSGLFVDLDFDVIMTIATGGMVLAPILSLLTNKPMGYVRPYVKSYGCRRQLEGVDGLLGKRVVLFDDLIGSGDSCLSALKAIENEGAVVVDIVTVADRRSNPEDLFEKVKVHSLLNCKNTYV
jgi:orotate phosphoribosyltransferase